MADGKNSETSWDAEHWLESTAFYPRTVVAVCTAVAITLGPGVLVVSRLMGSQASLFRSWAPYVNETLILVLSGQVGWSILASLLVAFSVAFGDRLLLSRHETTPLHNLLKSSRRFFVSIYPQVVTVLHRSQEGQVELLVMAKRTRFLEFLSYLEQQGLAGSVEWSVSPSTPCDTYRRFLASAVSPAGRLGRHRELLAIGMHLTILPFLIALVMGMSVYGSGEAGSHAFEYALVVAMLVFVFVSTLRVTQLWWGYLSKWPRWVRSDSRIDGDSRSSENFDDETGFERTPPMWPLLVLCERYECCRSDLSTA